MKKLYPLFKSNKSKIILKLKFKLKNPFVNALYSELTQKKNIL